MTKRIYLTIDDSPSKHTITKVDFLKSHQIPAIFFCRGEYISQFKDHLVYAIQHGFLLGNHSYSHPYFSQISLIECIQEIQITETLLNECYLQAGIKRPCKVIRLPYRDQGTPETLPQLQKFLKEQQFVSLDFGISLNQNFIDAPWTWDTYDYKHALINNSTAYQVMLAKKYQTSPLTDEIILLHDFNHNHHLFEATMTFLLQKETVFLPLNIQ